MTGAGVKPQSVAPDNLGERVFIGQVYPSGNVYLRQFSVSNSKPVWPDTLTIVPVSPAVPGVAAARRARFDRLLASKVENDVVKSLYIPRAEGMDDLHQPCGLEQAAPSAPIQASSAEDFFRTVADHCEPNDDVAVYRSTPATDSAMVIGTPIGLTLVTPTVTFAPHPRPMTAGERSAVESARSKADPGCTTVPAYLDAALQIFEASISGEDFMLRLSRFENPGCAGHLSTIYILDVMRNGEVLKSFELSQYQGAI